MAPLIELGEKEGLKGLLIVCVNGRYVALAWKDEKNAVDELSPRA